MSDWTLVYEGYEPAQEPLREALCTTGNGFFASRGAVPEAAPDGTHYPGTYIAGCYNRLTTEINDQAVENESLVNLPDWLALNFRPVDGDWFDPGEAELLEYRQTFELRNGILCRRVRFRDRAGRTTRVEQRRLVSLAQPHLGVLQTVIEAEDWSGDLDVWTAIDGRVTNSGVPRYRALADRHLAVRRARCEGTAGLLVEVETVQSRIRVAVASRTRFRSGGRSIHPPAVKVEAEDHAAFTHRLSLAQGTPVQIDKVAALYTGRDHAISEPVLEATKAVDAAEGYAELAERHRLLWQQLWQRFDFSLDHDDPDEGARTAQVLRLHVLHLLQTTSPHVIDLDVGVPARGLHGEAYRGHVFWDELFVFPLFNLRIPEITRALLHYRYRRLGEARRAARELGHCGAAYPWQSGSNGREESQRLHLNPKSGNWLPDHSHLQRHVGAAIAYNVWQYYQVTRDLEFLSFYGAEMMLEIARFWASLAVPRDDDRRYGIRQVMGPDEYHDAYPGAERPGLDNNAYTNVLAVWVLVRALELREILPTRRFTELCEALSLGNEELAYWDEVSRRMFVPFHDEGIISQFSGYGDLEEFDWDGYRERYGDIQRLDRILEAEGDTPNRYKVSKQADVVMLFYLFSSEELGSLFDRLGYPFEYDTIPRNIDYYMRRTSHGSTLSRVVHSWVLARANRPEGWRFFHQALESDIGDIQGGTTQEGIHTGAMAGTVDLIQRCFTGIETRDDRLRFNPRLPAGLKRLALNIRYRRHALDVEVTPTHLRISTAPCDEQPLELVVRDTLHRVPPGQIRVFPL